MNPIVAGRRTITASASAAFIALVLTARPVAAQGFTVVETNMTELRKALDEKRTTSREIVRQYLERIGT